MEPGMTAWKWFECWKRTLVDERLSRLAMSPTVSNTKSRVKPANAYQCQPGDEEDGCDSSVVNLGGEREVSSTRTNPWTLPAREGEESVYQRRRTVYCDLMTVTHMFSRAADPSATQRPRTRPARQPAAKLTTIVLGDLWEPPSEDDEHSYTDDEPLLDEVVYQPDRMVPRPGSGAVGLWSWTRLGTGSHGDGHLR
jgi:hypothetical protein